MRDDDAWLEVARHNRPGVTRVPLDGTRDVIVGRTEVSEVVLAGDGMVSKRHFSLSPIDGAWRVTDLRTVNGTYVNGLRVDESAIVFDGDVVTVGRASITVRVARARYGAWRAGEWVLFGPWRRGVLHAFGAQLRSAVDESAVAATLAGPLEARGRAEAKVVIDDVVGPSVRELQSATTALAAAFDPALAVAIARTVAVVEVAAPMDHVLVTFGGALVGVGDREPLPLVDRLRLAARTCLALVGCTASSRATQEAAHEQREELRRVIDVSSRIARDARAPLLAIADAAADDPVRVAFELGKAARALGEPGPAQLATLARELFPRAAARHARLAEDVGVLGAAGLLAPADS